MTDVDYAVSATGLLRDFNRADVLTAADVHVAATLGRLTGEADERVLLAVALAVRAVRHGSVCIDLGDVGRVAADAETDLPAWPRVEDWYAACRASALVAVGRDGDSSRPVRLVDRLLYLDRYWRQEELVRTELLARASRPPRELDLARLAGALQRLFPGDAPDDQRLAAAACAIGRVTVVAGGPGTGKTTTVARMLAVLGESWPAPPRVALAAPTGKAAARLQEAVAHESAALRAAGLPAPGELAASTLHRLLGWKPGSRTRFRHDRSNRLPHDVVVVDETSMVSLTMMARLLAAVRPEASLVLVGDPDQLASVEAGAVLGDLVGRPPRPAPDARFGVLSSLLPADADPPAEVEQRLRNDVVRLRTVHRFSGTIAELAEAVRLGAADAVVEVLRRGDDKVEFVEADVEQPAAGPAGLHADVLAAGRAVYDAAVAGDVAAALPALEQHRVLCAHRRGPFGVTRWSREVERWLAAAITGYGGDGEWHVGRPLIATANDYELKLYNGDTGVVVREPSGGVVAAFGRGAAPVVLPVGRLSGIETVHAMTVHRSQGSQLDRVTVILPPPESPLLTRELLYTAVTRAQSFVRVVGLEASVRAAVERPIVRASGLRR